MRAPRLKRLADLSDAELAEAHPQLGPEARGLLGVENAIKAFRSYGSTAPAEVEKTAKLMEDETRGIAMTARDPKLHLNKRCKCFQPPWPPLE